MFIAIGLVLLAFAGLALIFGGRKLSQKLILVAIGALILVPIVIAGFAYVVRLVASYPAVLVLAVFGLAFLGSRGRHHHCQYELESTSRKRRIEGSKP